MIYNRYRFQREWKLQKIFPGKQCLPIPPKKSFQGESFIFNLEINALYYIKDHLLRNLLMYIQCIHVHYIYLMK